MDFQGFPHQVAGDAPVTTLDVIVYSFVMVAMSGLGGLPFFLLPGGLSKRSAGLANALAAGVMLSASYTMIYEGQVAGPKAVVSGLFLGAAFMRCSRLFIEGREDVTLLGWSGQTTPKGTLLFLAIMAIHSIGEGAAWGWRRSTGEPSGFRRGGLVAVAIGAHNVPEGFGVALALITKGASPASASRGRAHAGAAARRGRARVPLLRDLLGDPALAMGFGAGAMIATVLSLATFEGFRMMLDWASHEPASAKRLLAALAWSFVAGGATSLGASYVFLFRKIGVRAEAALLGFAGGVMLALACLDIMLPAFYAGGRNCGGARVAVGSFVAGIGVVRVLDAAVRNMDVAGFVEARSDLEAGERTPPPASAHKTARAAALRSASRRRTRTRRAATMALAIGMHNVPEGVAVATSVLLATRSRPRAFAVATATGLVEPVSAVLSAAVLNPFLSPELLEASLLLVAGVMLTVSLGELLPGAARKHARSAAAGALFGWLTMRAGLALVKDDLTASDHAYFDEGEMTIPRGV
ncbi:zinc ion transmembrane transporter [Aureococcus anophagefferens]|nr:zinc ion transmembrane transporter [Aureococcus anophagefferens]